MKQTTLQFSNNILNIQSPFKSNSVSVNNNENKSA